MILAHQKGSCRPVNFVEIGSARPEFESRASRSQFHFLQEYSPRSYGSCYSTRLSARRHSELVSLISQSLGEIRCPNRRVSGLGFAVDGGGRLTGARGAISPRDTRTLAVYSDSLIWLRGEGDIVIRFDSSGGQFNLKRLVIWFCMEAGAISPLLRFRMRS